MKHLIAIGNTGIWCHHFMACRTEVSGGIKDIAGTKSYHDRDIVRYNPRFRARSRVIIVIDIDR